MKFSLVNLGCKVNRVETDSIGAALLGAGWESVRLDADAVVVNTCTVTAEADRKTRKEINRALARNPHALVLVTGCAAAVDPAAYEALSGRVRVVAKSDVVDACAALADRDSSGCQGELSQDEAGALSRMECGLRIGEEFPTRVGVKVQDGCDNACTYCIVHVARGRAVSRPLELVVEEVDEYARAGVREVVLTGIDLGAYRSDDRGLSELVMALRHAAPDVRLRLSSIEPHSLDDALVEVLACEGGMVCRHLHIPLQSGSSKVLREMARRYSAEEYLQAVDKIRLAVPEVSLTTDVIVGFPGETDGDFASTVELARACGFSRMHLFRYSKRNGTPAATRSDQIAPDVKAQRLASLEHVAAELRMEYAQARLGTTEQVLVESKGKGMSESYFEVVVPFDWQRGSLVGATLRNYDERSGCFSL